MIETLCAGVGSLLYHLIVVNLTVSFLKMFLKLSCDNKHYVVIFKILFV